MGGVFVINEGLQIVRENKSYESMVDSISSCLDCAKRTFRTGRDYELIIELYEIII
jgi:hypothetical protein